LRTHILSRNVISVKLLLMLVALAFLTTGCGRLPALTPDILQAAEARWDAHKPVSYRLVVEMSGDRVETGRFELEVREGRIVTLRRNGLVVRPGAGQDYTMEGLFRVLEQELSLAGKPAMLGAPSGYSAYLTARFDDTNGRLIRYRRTVGGASNAIEINVLEFIPDPR
jgi:hypothetical protein